MRKLIFVSAMLAQGAAFAQAPQPAQDRPFSYDYAELRLVDADDDGDGLEIRGSYALDRNWILLGGIRDLDFGDNVDWQLLDIGAGYVWHYRPEFDLVGIVKYLDADVDTPSGGGSDSGLGLSAGIRGWLSSAFELRGFVHYQGFDDSDTFLEMAGDYYINEQFAVGLSLEFAGDNDALTVGGRWFFR